jgi:hypothetical protein
MRALDEIDAIVTSLSCYREVRHCTNVVRDEITSRDTKPANPKPTPKEGRQRSVKVRVRGLSLSVQADRSDRAWLEDVLGQTRDSYRWVLRPDEDEVCTDREKTRQMTVVSIAPMTTDQPQIADGEELYEHVRARSGEVVNDGAFLARFGFRFKTSLKGDE